MSNLIITVISIALVAVASLTGAYYSGQAFLDGQAKARANSLIQGAEQIAGAWHMYAIDNGAIYTMTDMLFRDGTATNLVPKYLAQLPRFSFIDRHATYEYYLTPARFSSPGGFNWQHPNSDLIVALGLPDKVCKQINLIAKGSATVGPNYSTITTKTYFQPFACVVYGASTYIFIYRMF